MATYLGEKLHTNVQLPAILPGARGAALLWQGAAAATGLVLGAGQVYGGAAPFGLAFTMVCPPLYLFAAAGGVLISSLAFQPAVLGVKVIAALTATVAVRRLQQDKPNTKNAGIWAGCLALALAQAAVLFFAGGYVDLSQAAATGTTALLAAGSAWLMRRFPYREPRGLCLWLAIAAACLQRCARGPLAPGLAVAAAAGLCAAFAGTLEETAVVSITLAAAITAASPNLCYAALAVALGSLAAACLYPGERLRCAGVFAAGCVLGALAAPDAAGVLPLFVAGAVGLGAALAVPGTWLRVVFPPPAPPVQTQGLSGAARRLAGVADTLSDIADTVNAVCTRQMPPKGENFDFVVEHIARTTCQTCTRRSRCWVRGYATAMDGLYQLKPTLESRGRVEVEDLPGQLSVCIHPADLCTAANHGYRLWRSRRQTRARASMLRTALTEQYSAVAEALGVLSEQLGRPGDPEPYKSSRVAEFFTGLGAPPQECAVTLDDLGRTHAAVTLPRTRFTPQELAALAGEVGHICRRTLEVPQVLSCKGMTTLLFSERPALRAVFGAASAAARGEVSGDAVQQFCSPTAAQMILCDGMGTGRPAAVDGNLAAELTARLLKAGFTAELAARLVNVALALKSEDESGATLDLISVDLYTGTARLFKAGAAPGFLVHGGRVRAVGEATLPMGVLGGVNGQSRVVHLTAGDYAVLVSDGLLVDGAGWVAKQVELSAAAGDAPEKLAETLVQTARIRAQKTGRPDDITAAVLRLEKSG